MRMHDWTKVEAGIFHHFHHYWISAISEQLNGQLPSDYYALAEQFAGGFGPDVLTLQSRSKAKLNELPRDEDQGGGGAVLLVRPKTGLSVSCMTISCGTLVLPSRIAPAPSSRVTSGPLVLAG